MVFKNTMRLDEGGYTINDFGTPLSGARKNLQMTIDTIDAMGVKEILDKVKKNNLWPQPDWKELSQSYDAKNAYFVRILRDKFKASLGIRRILNEDILRSYAKEYLSVLGALLNACDIFLATGDMSCITDNIAVSKNQINFPALRANLESLLNISKAKTDDACELQDFPTNIIGALKYAYVYERRHIKPDGSFSCLYIIARDKKGAKGVVEQVNLFNKVFTTREQAIEYARGNIVTLKRRSAATSNMVYYLRPELKKIDRKGPDLRHNTNVLEFDLLNTFNIAGGEFGKWQNQQSRQAFINYTFDALSDLAYVLNIPHTAVSLEHNGKKLSLSYGARGSGFQEKAIDTFDANDNEIIHIQKLSGAGWVARAYGKAVDNYIGKLYSGSGGKSAMSWYWARKYTSSNMNTEIYNAYAAFMGTVYRCDSYTHTLRGIFRNSVNSRIFPLCFEAYVEDKLKEAGMYNYFLVYGTYPNNATSNIAKDRSANFYRLYPQGDERKIISNAMSDLLEVVFKHLRADNTSALNGFRSLYSDVDYKSYSESEAPEGLLYPQTAEDADKSALSLKNRVDTLFGSQPAAKPQDLSNSFALYAKNKLNLPVYIVDFNLIPHTDDGHSLYPDIICLDSGTGSTQRAEELIATVIEHRMYREEDTPLNTCLTELATYYFCKFLNLDRYKEYCGDALCGTYTFGNKEIGYFLDRLAKLEKEILYPDAA